MKNRTTTQSKQQIEIRTIAAELHLERREREEGSRTIAGYAAKFECWSEAIGGWFRERIARGAFEGCDMEDVIMCFNHSDSDILARTGSGTLSLSVDDVGLRFKFDAPNTARGNDMVELVRRGDISRCSFRFVVESDEWLYADENNGLKIDERTITRFAALRDVSLVVFPAYPDTEASLRHLEERKMKAMTKTETTDTDNDSTFEQRNRVVEQLRLKNREPKS